MKAVSITAPGKISFTAIDDLDSKLQPEEVLLRVLYVGYCGSDLNSYRGLNPLVEYPRIPGHEVSGEVVAKGNKVASEVVIGTRVSVFPYTNCGKCRACQKGRPNACKNNQTYGVQRDGCLTEYIKIHQEKLIISSLQDARKLAMVEPFAVGFHAVRRPVITAGDYIAVIGAGIIGMGAILSALEHTDNVLVIDISDQKLDFVKKLGVKYTINASVDNTSDRILEITDGHGVDIAIEAVGQAQTFRQCVDIAAYGGQIVYIGYPKEEVTYDVKYFLLKELNILGSRGAEKIDFQNVIQFFSDNESFDIERFYKEYSFEDATKAMDFWNNNPEEVIKILINTNS